MALGEGTIGAGYRCNDTWCGCGYGCGGLVNGASGAGRSGAERARRRRHWIQRHLSDAMALGVAVAVAMAGLLMEPAERAGRHHWIQRRPSTTEMQRCSQIMNKALQNEDV